jgi:(2Fe-2S) ferredoxin
MARFEKHIFICENERSADDPRGSCTARGSASVLEEFKKLTHPLKGKVRTNRAGCLDACQFGVTVVVYPDGVWYGGVKAEDVKEIFEKHIVGGQPVERLRIDDKLAALKKK